MLWFSFLISSWNSFYLMKKSMSLLDNGVLILLFVSSIFSTQGISSEMAQLHVGDIIKDGETLVSKNGIFILGFFDPNQNGTRYLGLWYNFSTESVVWVANRENPITNSFGVLQLTGDGDLIISQNQSSTSTDDQRQIFWSSNSSNSMVIINPVATLLDNGNLIITNGTEDGGSSSIIIWQSFDYPTDTLLPGMKLGFNKKIGFQWYLTSWKQSYVDPSLGKVGMKMYTIGSHETYFLVDNQKFSRLGSWNGERFIGTRLMATISDRVFTFVENENEAFFCFIVNDSSYERIVVFPNKSLARMVNRNANIPNSNWISYIGIPDLCDRYSYCGPNGVCDPQNIRKCKCFVGFHPKSTISWSRREYSMGCERDEILNCTDEEGFLLISGVKLPETTNFTFVDKGLSIDECKDRCINNCSCMAYAPVYLESFKNRRGCIMWYEEDLVDTLVDNPDQDGLELYLRLPKSQLPKNSSEDKKKIMIIAPVVIGVTIILLFGIFVFIRKKKGLQREILKVSSDEHNRKWKDEVPLFSFLTIASWTNNFSNVNIIGHGGFAVVYKGIMEDGQEIAVKRQGNSSRQGLDDFMNEVVLIAKLQHRNLLQLLGCCMERDERILVYEFMKNSSLDTFIFGENRHLLDWQKRVEIIIGISRGLLYLHQDSRLRIIHRDLKPANVLLDETMNPKISDFDTARLSEAEQLENRTRRVVGTYGYMSPEYANGGLFSIKSDIFSFGVLLLEIISGKKNHVYTKYKEDLNLLERAWTLSKEGKSLMLLDENLSNTCSTHQVLRLVQVGLLCVQDKAIDRPTMSEVFLMLSNENLSIKEAKRPAFCNDSLDRAFEQVYTNDTVSLTKLEGR